MTAYKTFLPHMSHHDCIKSTKRRKGNCTHFFRYKNTITKEDITFLFTSGKGKGDKEKGEWLEDSVVFNAAKYFVKG
jgi:hypothetical protein